MDDAAAWCGWREATTRALYGEGGFYRRAEGPAGHFRTSVHVSPLFAAALARLARSRGLGRVVDVGAGRGELLRSLHEADPGLALHGVDVVGRPDGLPTGLTWSTDLPRRLHGALVVANEWLDDVPCEVVQVHEGAWRLVLVDPSTGQQRLDGEPDPQDRAWLGRWWPVGSEGDRAEVGRPRDAAWADVVRRLEGSLAVTVDYAHDRADRAGGRWARGTVTGWRDGRLVAPVPDGSCDVTAHVALDACAAAGVAAGAEQTRLTTQREALRGLGVHGVRPPRALAAADPRAYVRALSRAGEGGELLDTSGLGAFGWLEQSRGLG